MAAVEKQQVAAVRKQLAAAEKALAAATEQTNGNAGLAGPKLRKIQMLELKRMVADWRVKSRVARYAADRKKLSGGDDADYVKQRDKPAQGAGNAAGRSRKMHRTRSPH